MWRFSWIIWVGPLDSQGSLWEVHWRDGVMWDTGTRGRVLTWRKSPSQGTGKATTRRCGIKEARSFLRSSSPDDTVRGVVLNCRRNRQFLLPTQMNNVGNSSPMNKPWCCLTEGLSIINYRGHYYLKSPSDNFSHSSNDTLQWNF